MANQISKNFKVVFDPLKTTSLDVERKIKQIYGVKTVWAYG